MSTKVIKPINKNKIKNKTKNKIDISNEMYFNINSDIYKDCVNIDEKFALLSNNILNNFKLNIDEKIYSIQEIEYYYYCDEHKDSYTHKTKDQMQNCKWYFHKYHNGTYKSGTYKGMDMTFGNEKDMYGGILIRSICNDETKEFITGSCNVVNHILKLKGLSETIELVNTMEDLSLLNKNNTVHLTRNDIAETGIIYTGPRVGLSTKYPEYLFKQYRFLKQPNKIPKYRNTIISTLYNKGMSQEDIISETGLTKNSVKKAIEEFNEGKTKSEKEIKDLDNKKINLVYGYYSTKF